jgi:mycofactocin precursor peptide peptidase
VRVVTTELGAFTWTDIAHRSAPPLLVVPLGACEQHGPHLPLDVDTRVAVALATGLANTRPDVLVTPAITVSASGEHGGFPGTLSVGTAVLTAMIVELVRSADWAAGVIVVNGHGGNHEALQAAASTLAAERRGVLMWSPSLPPGGDLHAGRIETSLMLALAPNLVREARPTGPASSLAELWPAMRSGGVAAVSSSGVLGDAHDANALYGHDLLATWIADLVAAVARSWPLTSP